LRVRTALWLATLLVVAGIALLVYGQLRPVVDASQAATIAQNFMAVNSGGAWIATSETVSYNGDRPSSLPDQPATCWGSRWPLRGGCLPYPIWLVHLFGVTPDGQCLAVDAYVDGRTGKVHQYQSADCP